MQIENANFERILVKEREQHKEVYLKQIMCNFTWILTLEFYCLLGCLCCVLNLVLMI